MKLYINVKQAGSRKNYIAKEEIILSTRPLTLRQLVAAIVSENVKNFNTKVKGNALLNYLTKEEINEKLVVGKVSFGEAYNPAETNLEKALECAYLAYEDGIYRVFINDAEVDQLDDQLHLKEEDVLTFVRLTMLAGRMW